MKAGRIVCERKKGRSYWGWDTSGKGLHGFFYPGVESLEKLLQTAKRDGVVLYNHDQDVRQAIRLINGRIGLTLCRYNARTAFVGPGEEECWDIIIPDTSSSDRLEEGRFYLVGETVKRIKREEGRRSLRFAKVTLFQE